MSALPADIAKYTVDGVVITNENAALRAAHPEATDRLDSPIEMFFDSVADGQAMLDEKFALLSTLNPAHEGIEIEDNLRLGQDIAIAPTVPCFRIVDDERELDVVARTRAFAYETGDDRFSLELIE
jgi:hypothetical protein